MTSGPNRPATCRGGPGPRWRSGCARARWMTWWASSTCSARVAAAPAGRRRRRHRARGPSSLILWGPPGTGKTTLAHVIARGPGRKFVELSAITAGVKDVRRVMDEALTARDLHRTTTVLFLDEIHRFNKAQQDALLPGVENRWVVLVAATTENPSFSVVSPLLSRSLLLTLKPLTDDDIEGAAAAGRGGRTRAGRQGGAQRRCAGAPGPAVRRGRPPRPDRARGRGRRRLGADDADDERRAAGTRRGSTLDHAERAMDAAAVRYDRAGDQHYDVTSAFIKSIRGSDVDASLHYLARMLEAGEDPRFVARRHDDLAPPRTSAWRTPPRCRPPSLRPRRSS